MSKYTTRQLIQMLSDKVQQKTGQPSFQMRKLFGCDGGPFKPLNPAELKQKLELYNMFLTDKQAQDVFEELDDDGSGSLDMNEFLHAILPKDYVNLAGKPSQDHWSNRSEQQEIDAVRAKQNAPTGLANCALTTLPAHAPRYKDLREVLSKIQTKLRERTGQSMGPLERIFHWFGTGSTCTPSMLREALLKTGVVLTDNELQTLFSCIDDDGSGALDLHELCRNLSEEDYPGGCDNYHWVKRRDEMDAVDRAVKKAGPDASLQGEINHVNVAKLTPWSQSLEEMIHKLQIKVEQRTSGALRQQREAYRLFDRDHGGFVEPNEFQRVAAELGFLLSDEDVIAFFRRHDKDGDGLLDIHEFAAAMQPKEGVAPRSLCREPLPRHLEMPTHENRGCRDRRMARMCPVTNRMVQVQPKVPAHQTSEKLQPSYQAQPRSWAAPQPPSSVRPGSAALAKHSPYARMPKSARTSSSRGGGTARPQTARCRATTAREATNPHYGTQRVNNPQQDFSYTTREEWDAKLKASLHTRPQPPSPVNERKMKAAAGRPKTAAPSRERRSLRPQTARPSRQTRADPALTRTTKVDDSYTTREEWDAMVKDSFHTQPQPPSPVNERKDYAHNRTKRVGSFVAPTERPKTSASAIPDWAGPI